MNLPIPPAARRPSVATRRRYAGRCARRGQALVEFAIVALVLMLIVAGILSFGQMFFAAYIIQQAADVGAQETARTPLPATGLTLNDLLFARPLSSLSDPNQLQAVAQFRATIYDESKLVVPLSTDVSTLPLVNRLLSTVMLVDQTLGMRRFPGTLVTNADNKTTVLVLVADNTTDIPTYAWKHVVEMTASSDAADTFDVSTAAGGVVSLRINYPFQSGSLLAWSRNTDGSTGPPIAADDTSYVPALPSGYTIYQGSTDPRLPSYSGQYGLGVAHALKPLYPNGVRPYRRVVTALGAYRREVFQ